MSRLSGCGILKVVGWKMAPGAISCDTARVVSRSSSSHAQNGVNMKS